jgi:hypothetical protein
LESDLVAARVHKVLVSLDEGELAVLDEHRGSIPRAVYLRRLLQGPPQEPDVATRSEAMSLLTQLAREGRTPAAIALAKELRESGERDVMSWILGADAD